jgi:HAD superfamily hydrolase (TIGR01549 family)
MTDPKSDLTAVIWDFDGTLADTRFKNLSVNRRIVAEVTGRPWTEFAAVRSIEAYDEAVRRAPNWRELYRENFGFSDDECDRAASVWAAYQLEDRTPAPIFDGLPAVIAELAGRPQGIVSQNARDHMIERLTEAGLHHHFGSIVGYEEVPPGRQKPDPDGLLMCLEELTGFQPGIALYIGDHEGDVLCALNTNAALKDRGAGLLIETVGAFFADGSNSTTWTHQPTYSAQDPEDVPAIIASLRNESV